MRSGTTGAGPELVAVPDLAGTPAADAEGCFFGEVFGALAEERTGLIRYLDLDVRGTGRHVLVPIGHVRVPRPGAPRAEVRLRAATAGDLASIPANEPGRPLRGIEDEEALLAAHGRLFAGERYYAHPAFDHAGLAVRSPARSAPEGAILETADEGRAPVRASRLAGDGAIGQPDIRGWPLRTRDGMTAGTVVDLLVDPRSLTPRYAVVGRETDEVLLPVGYLEIDEAGGRVRAHALRADDVRSLPAQQGRVTRADEDALRVALDARLSDGRRFQRADFRGLAPGA